MKLKEKLVLSFGSVIIVTLAVFSIIIYYTFMESGKSSATHVIKLQSGEIHSKAEALLLQSIEDTHRKITPFIESFSDNEQTSQPMTSIFKSTVDQTPLIDSITLHNVSSNIFYPPNLQSLSLTRKLLRSEVLFSQQPFFLNDSSSTYLVFPFISSGKVIQLLLEINPESFLKTILDYNPIKDSTVIFAQGDTSLFDRKDSKSSKETPSFSIIDFRNPETETMGIVYANKKYAYLHPDKIFSSDLILAVPEKFFVKNLITLKNRIITALLILCWCSIWVILIVSNTITSPIRKLSKMTKDIESFNYDSQVGIISKDEIGELAENFENMRQTIKSMVTKDPLTNVYNRRFLMHIFELAVLRALRLEHDLCCIMLDIDFFKKVNDNFGHQCGDEVLIQVGKVLLDLSRNYETPARYGGEEFILILPETTIKNAENIAERIRKAVEKLVITYEGKEIRCTTSLGVSCLNRYTANTTAQIIQKADNALYLAKERGRNQTVVDGGTLQTND